MRIGKKVTTGLLILVLMVVTSIGCSKKSELEIENAEITVLVSDQGTSSLGVQLNALLEKSKQVVEENNEGIEVTIVKVPPEQYQDKIKELSPDVFWFNPTEIENLEQEGKLYDLNSLLDSENVDISKFYSPNIIVMTTVNDKFLGVTLSAYNMSIGYSKDWFDKANLPYPLADWTWEDFEAAAIRLKQANGAYSQFAYGAMIPLHPEFIETIAMGRGSGFLSPDGSQATDFWDGPQAVETVLWLRQLIDNGAIPALAGSEMGTIVDKLGTETGMVMSFTPTINELAKSSDRIGIVGLPHFADGIKVSAPYITVMGISSTSKYPQAAWKYINSLTLEDNPITREAFQMGVSISSAVFEKIGDQVEPAIAIDYNELQYAQKRSSMKSKEWGNILNRYAGEWMLLFETDDDPAPRLHEMAKGIDSMLAEARVKNTEGSQH
ncbi:ABC transporter substrate-binding protein [Cohnella suwonensis]|uniref:ABC transporter substrate-binding protein n=1 Tax=Cohnella suwonensis TaxID=696072 RepID=A0ABW0LXJ6_9BACL